MEKIRKTGFTLIELLVVIAIISGLSALLVPNFMGARERARDAQRKSDLKQIQKALEMYRQDQNPPAYPEDGFFTNNNNEGQCWTSEGIGIPCPGGNIYMNKIPTDPNRGDGYYFDSDNTNLTYTLCACLENKADSEAVDGNCSNSYICNSGKKYVVNQP